MFLYLSLLQEIRCPWGLFPQSSRSWLWLSQFDTIDPSSIDVSSAWLQDCYLNHEATCSTKGESRLPNRVLAIGDSLDNIRLLETNNGTGGYACPSHCWGGSQVLKTRHNNLEDNKSCIPWEGISKTFQDAIIVARSLNIEYLWIDSLCIIQDDSADWIRELKEMCNIYENSQLTIAATSAPNATAGLFLKDRIRHKICGSTSTGTNFRFIVCKTDNTHPNKAMEGDPAFEIWPLLKRAWVLQERMLSPRVIRFGKTELMWECRHLARCECEIFKRNDLVDAKSKNFELLTQSTNASLIEAWHRLIETYCPLGLTVLSDKFPALSGLAKQMAKLRPRATYLAGLWSDSLERDLLWINGDTGVPEIQIPIPAERHAPSWSWASTNGNISHIQNGSFQDEKYPQGPHIFFSVSDARTQLATDDPTGQVLGGSITITGPTLEAIFVDTLDPTQHWKVMPDKTRFGIRINNSGQEIRQHINSVNQVFFDIPSNPFVLDLQLSLFHGSVKCIRMARVPHMPQADGVSHNEEWAMIVAPLRSATSFRRIGMLVLGRNASVYVEDPQESEQAWKENSSFWEEDGVVETITIV